MLKPIEILSPSGSRETLLAALNTGADAVYLGLDNFSARKNAENFTGTELIEVVNMCRLSNVKVYLTLNTLVFDDEIVMLRNFIETAKDAKIDAVIVQDLGTYALVKEIAPSMPLHASTQMTVTSISGAKAMKALGFKRVVLARELSADEIKEIANNVEIEIEVFVHGALCVSLSGMCYISGVFGGRSGNRGLCAQPCRLGFSDMQRENVLSLKDLTLIDKIKELEEIGVCSIKIEGRMKRPEYVAAVTNACYNTLKTGNISDGEMQDLKAIFSRSGFTAGYYNGSMRDMNGIRTKEDVLGAGDLLSKFKKLYSMPLKRFIIDMDVKIKHNDDISCFVVCSEINSLSELKIINFKLPPAEDALKKETTAVQVTEQLSKLGGTIFKAGKINCEIDGGLWLSAAQLNNIRREMINKINEELLASL